ncbi:MAG: phosphoribosylformylglycinamidine synthase subunit PurQ [Actinomycetaceae bacterium]|nr:phosphoribosylformylglycinamidine synthase subunit PurQ [Actinomycetaceae bacterium]MDU0971039.1 phosphoribosylformylglycinamidine synthase subunit PurQ [Actinomycetaceae bacterium]
MSPRIGVVTFPGTLDDVDARRAVEVAGGEAVALWHKDADLHGVDAIVLPGGFSYGDYLRCGAISRFSPVMELVIDAANAGMPVLGICNGFQVLCEAHLLPGALVRNAGQTFRCEDKPLIVENATTPWTSLFSAGQRIVIPLKHGEGSYQAAPDDLERLEGDGRVVFRYDGENPNGSANNIAGVCSEKGNVVGLMPHPEHAVEVGFGPDTASGIRCGLDGLQMFVAALEAVAG